MSATGLDFSMKSDDTVLRFALAEFELLLSTFSSSKILNAGLLHVEVLTLIQHECYFVYTDWLDVCICNEKFNFNH